jgi:hypothetical protein
MRKGRQQCQSLHTLDELAVRWRYENLNREWLLRDAVGRMGSGSVWERSLILFEMTHGLCSCHSEQSEESFSILIVVVD